MDRLGDPSHVPDRPATAAVPFVGRRSELATLTEALAEAADASPNVVLVTGPAGIGKTTLIRRALDEAVSPLRILRSAGAPEESRLPYAIVGQLTSGQITAGPDPVETGSRLLQFLGAVESDHVTVAVVDDAQWADAESLQAFLFAVRRLRTDRVLAVIAARDDEPLPESVERGSAAITLRRVGLHGLAAGEVGELSSELGRPLEPPEIEALHGQTEGNPLYIEALVRELGTSGFDAGPQPLPAPKRFAEAVLERAAAMGAESLAFLQACSVCGRETPVPLAAQVANVSSAVQALDETMASGLLQPVASERVSTVRFAHPLVRSAIYHAMGAEQRSSMHLRAAELTDGSISMDHRVAAAMGTSEALAKDLAAAANTEAATGALGTASRRLRAAADLAPDQATRQRFLMDACTFSVLAGDLAGATPFAELAQSFPVGARRSYVLGHFAFATGRQGEAETLLLGAWQEAAEERSLASDAASVLCYLYLFWQRYEDVVVWGRRALLDGGSPLAGLAIGALPVALRLLGRPDEAVAETDRLRTGTTASGEPDRLLGRGIVHLWCDRLDEAIADLSEVVDVSRDWRPLRTRLLGLGFLSEAEYRAGLWDDALTNSQLATSLAVDLDQTWILPFVHAQAVAPLAGRGRFEEAEHHASAADAAAATLGDQASLAYAATARGQIAEARGDMDGVLDALRPLLEIERNRGTQDAGVFAWRPLHITALVTTGNLEEAAGAVADLERDVTRLGFPCQSATAARARGVLEAATGDLDAARDALDRALVGAEGFPFREAQIAETLACLLHPRDPEARRLLSQAQTIYRRLGAAPFLKRLPAATRRRPRSVEDLATLTPQETSVTRLVARGMTNRQIAEQLVVSVKTVEYHLSNVYAKFNVSSRVELALRYTSGTDPEP